MMLLHIYAQEQWHDDAVIAGTREALEGLRETIDRALSDGRGKTQAFVNDGEGYTVHVVLVSEEQADEMPVPYWGDLARAKDAVERMAVILRGGTP